MLRTIGVAVIALVVGVGLGLAKDAGADQPSVATKTPVPCLLALEAGWKTINQTPAGVDHKAEFDARYAECLAAS